MDGETKLDRAPVKAMEREFGIPDNPRNYYVIKKVRDLERKMQMEWFLENVLMLIKSKYMSDKNYAFLYAIEKGKKIAWAYVLHNKLLAEIRETDKRKVHKTSRLGPALAVIFASVKNLETLYGKSYASKIVPYNRGVKRLAGKMDDDDELPPSKQQTSVTKKEEDLVQGYSTPQRSQTELTQLNKVYPKLSAANAKKIEEMLTAGCTKEDIVHSLQGPKPQSEPLFVTPLASKPREKSQVSQGSVQKQGLKLKFGKAKVLAKSESPVPTEPFEVPPSSDIQIQISTTDARRSWRQVDLYLQQQSTMLQTARKL